MKNILSVLLSLIAFILLCSHDMFLKFDNYHLEPNSQAVLQLFNGTFEKSDNVIDRNRMTDVSLVGHGKRRAVDSADWFEKNDITFLNFKTGQEGTWLAGVSTAPRSIELKADDFNKYLKSDGVLEVLEDRKQNNTLDQDAIEQYAKHVKTIFQVGDERSNDWTTNLGYPLEFIPLQNPYDIHPGHHLDLRLLYKGQPLKNHFVYVGSDSKTTTSESTHSHDGEATHSHSHDTTEASEHQHPATQQYKTNEDGVIRIDIDAQGTWYLRTIKMIAATDKALTHQSDWATLTFGIGAGHSADHSHHQEQEHEHGPDTHTHDADAHTHEAHEDEDAFPTYMFWIGSILVIGLLFFWFNRKH